MNTTFKPLLLVTSICTALSASHAYSEESNATDERLEEKERAVEKISILGYHTEDASSLLRNGLSLKETPRAVQIFDDETIEAFKPYAIEDVLQFSPNTNFLGTSDGRSNAFSMRGFQDAPILRDGFRVETFGGVSDPELYNLEQIEILKGPDSILYGEANPGGIINMRSKRPKKESHAEIQVDVGSNSLLYPKVDFGGAVTDSLSYRIVGVYFEDGTFRDYDNKNERTFFAPTLTWDVSDYTSITFLAEFTNDDFQADFGSAMNTDGELFVPIGQVNNHPQDTIDRHQYTYGVDVSHSLSENWQLNARYRDFDAGYEYSALFLPFRYNFEDNTYLRVPAVQGQQNDEQALQLSTSGDFEVAGLRNRLVVGVDYRDTDQVNITRFDPTTASILDWLNPDYSELPPNAEDLPLFPTRKDNVERLGIFAQNHLNVTDELVVSFGVRKDSVERTPQSDSTSAAQDLDNTSYQFGVNYELNENFTVFASYSESFLPNFDLDKNNNVIDPEQGKGYEIGVKGFELANSVNFTLSYFDITKNNVSMADPTAGPEDPNPFGSIASAEQDSRGIELEWHGNVTDSWEVNGSFGVTDSEDMGQEDIFGAADMTASLWTTYTFNMIGDWGFAAGGGLTHVGERLAIRDPDGNGDTSDALYLDSHTLLTLYARANWQQWQFQLNLQNVTDEEYITSAAGDYARGVHPGAPFTAVASATYSF